MALNGTLHEERGVFAFAEKVRTERSAASTWVAVGAHAVLLVALILLLRPRTLESFVKPLHIADVLTDPFPPPVLHANDGGSSGGHAGLSAASMGHPPQFATTTLMPPMAEPRLDAELPIAPTVTVHMAENSMPNLGVPDSSSTRVSLGNARHGGGIGDTDGDKSGAGTGTDWAGNGSFSHIGGGVKAPKLLLQTDAEYSEEARKAKFSGNVLVYLIVDEHGNPTHVRVQRGIGMGLDEKAVEAVRQYRFKPATDASNKPVRVDLTIDVNFRIF